MERVYFEKAFQIANIGHITEQHLIRFLDLLEGVIHSQNLQITGVGKMHFVVLIAGLGSRLGDLTKERPKCLIEIDGKTILERLLEQAEETGEFTDIIVLTGYMSETINEFIDGWNQRETDYV